MKIKISDNLSYVDKLKARVLALKPLPDNWTEQFVQAHPDYDTIKKISLIRRVGNLQQADYDITEKLEKLFGGK